MCQNINSEEKTDCVYKLIVWNLLCIFVNDYERYVTKRSVYTNIIQLSATDDN
jgi:hypothetical protein